MTLSKDVIGREGGGDMARIKTAAVDHGVRHHVMSHAQGHLFHQMRRLNG